MSFPDLFFENIDRPKHLWDAKGYFLGTLVLLDIEAMFVVFLLEEELSTNRSPIL